MKIYSAAILPECAADWSDGASHENSPKNKFKEGHHSSSRKKDRRREARSTDSALGIETLDDSESVEDLALSPTNGIKFCSRSEAICAELLLRYVPHFELRDGITFQVAVGKDAQGNTLAVDFLVDGVLFEYHPVKLFKSRRRCGDFSSKREYRAYADICHSLRGDQREFFQSSMRARLTQNYYAKRRALLDEHPMYRRMELVVASTPEEFYQLILKRFGKNVPRSVERFRAIFDELRESLPECGG